MKYLVCESLQEFFIVESISDAKKMFSDQGFGPEDEIYTEFFKQYKDNPEYIAKLAKWILDNPKDWPKIDKTFLQFLKLKDKKQTSKSINDFEKLNQFKQYIDKAAKDAAKENKINKEKEKKRIS